MRRPLALLAAPALLALPSAAHAQAPAQPAANVAAPALPAGWTMRLDRPNAKAADVKFVTMGQGYHATTGPAAIFYDPKMTATGAYDLEATFTQTKAPAHPEAYGLIAAGEKLDAADQSYIYFIVRGDGKYAFKHRAGAEVHTITDWTTHAAIKAQDAAGKATNALRIRVTADSLFLDANGTTVERHANMIQGGGVVGLRVNHNLDVHVDGPRLTKR